MTAKEQVAKLELLLGTKAGIQEAVERMGGPDEFVREIKNSITIFNFLMNEISEVLERTDLEKEEMFRIIEPYVAELEFIHMNLKSQKVNEEVETFKAGFINQDVKAMADATHRMGEKVFETLIKPCMEVFMSTRSEPFDVDEYEWLLQQILSFREVGDDEGIYQTMDELVNLNFPQNIGQSTLRFMAVILLWKDELLEETLNVIREQISELRK